MNFDMDMHVKKNQEERPLYAIVIKKKTSKSEDRYFIVMKRAGGFLPMVYNGVGFWSNKIPNLDLTADKQILQLKEYEEVWIPYENIDYVKSLVYIKR